MEQYLGDIPRLLVRIDLLFTDDFKAENLKTLEVVLKRLTEVGIQLK